MDGFSFKYWSSFIGQRPFKKCNRAIKKKSPRGAAGMLDGYARQLLLVELFYFIDERAAEAFMVGVGGVGQYGFH